MAVPLAPVRVPSQRPLAPSVALVASVDNNKDDNEMKSSYYYLIVFSLFNVHYLDLYISNGRENWNMK